MILCYHKIFPASKSKWWVTVDNFYRQMLELRAYDVVSLSEYDFRNKNQVVITFDGVYDNILTFAAPILFKFKYPFELFIVGDSIGRGNEFDFGEPPCQFASLEQLKELRKLGGRVQWHSKTHKNLAAVHDKTVICSEIEVPATLQDLDRTGFKWFAYPHGEFSTSAIEEISKRFDGALSCDKGDNSNKFTMPRKLVFNDSTFARASIGVAIVSYNYGRFLHEAVESVLAQTRKPDRIVICDDASSDSTAEIAHHYAQLYPELIHLVINETNLGIVKTFNGAVEKLATDYVVFLGADNRLQSNYIEKCAEVLDATDERIAIAYTDYALFGPEAAKVYSQHRVERMGPIKQGTYFVIQFPEFDWLQLQHSNYIHGSSMYRLKAYEDVGGYLEGHGKPEDHNLFARMSRAGWRGQKVWGTFLEYRQHSPEQANTKLKDKEELEFYRIFVGRLQSRINLYRELFRYLRPILTLIAKFDAFYARWHAKLRMRFNTNRRL